MDPHGPDMCGIESLMKHEFSECWGPVIAYYLINFRVLSFVRIFRLCDMFFYQTNLLVIRTFQKLKLLRSGRLIYLTPPLDGLRLNHIEVEMACI